MKKIIKFIQVMTWASGILLLILKCIFNLDISIAPIIIIFAVSISTLLLLNIERIGVR